MSNRKSDSSRVKASGVVAWAAAAAGVAVLVSAARVQADSHAGGAGVLTAEDQAGLTPDAVLNDLMAGNARFVAGELEKRDFAAEVEATATGQFPQAIILSCVDSRVPVELVFDQRIGDVFVARVAGNVENVDILGSMEFATKVAGSKVVMVLGHSACGAVKGACDAVELGNLTELLSKISPAVESAAEGFDGADLSSKNGDFVAAVTERNVEMTVADIRKSSPVLAELEESGSLKIVGAVYDLESGEVTMLED